MNRNKILKTDQFCLFFRTTPTNEQNLALQEDALRQAGCEEIVTDEISGSVADRPGLAKLKEKMRKGDTLVVWRLDRLGRSLKHLIALVNELESSGVGFKSLQEAIDTTSATGKLIFHIFASLAEFERHLIKERTMAGLVAARARGRLGGRPKRLDAAKRQVAIKLYLDKQHTVQTICRMMGISKPTLYHYLQERDKN